MVADRSASPSIERAPTSPDACPKLTSRPRAAMHSSECSNVSLPTASKTTSTPRPEVKSKTALAKLSRGHRQVERARGGRRRHLRELRSGDSPCFGDRAPDCKGPLARSAAKIGEDGFGIGNVKEVRDLIVDRQKPLRLADRFETLHDPLAPPRRLMRILSAIVQSFMLAMFDAKAHLRSRSPIGAQLVGDYDARWRDRGLEERLHEPLRCRGVPSSLDQNLENEAVLVDCAPQPMCLTRDRDDDFIQMPFVAASRRTLADRVSEGLAEFLPPWRTVSHGTQIPRAANISSTIRRLEGNRKYSQTAWLITSGGKRWRRSRRSRARGTARL